MLHDTCNCHLPRVISIEPNTQRLEESWRLIQSWRLIYTEAEESYVGSGNKGRKSERWLQQITYCKPIALLFIIARVSKVRITSREEASLYIVNLNQIITHFGKTILPFIRGHEWKDLGYIEIRSQNYGTTQQLTEVQQTIEVPLLQMQELM